VDRRSRCGATALDGAAGSGRKASVSVAALRRMGAHFILDERRLGRAQTELTSSDWLSRLATVRMAMGHQKPCNRSDLT